MPTIEGIIKTLNNMVPELDVTHHEVVKNTVKLQALNIKPQDSNIAPCIYIDNLLDTDMSNLEAAEKVLDIFNHAQPADIDIVSKLTDPDFIKSHVRIGLQRSDDSCEYLTRESGFENIMEYLYLTDEAADLGNISVKVTDQLLSAAGIEPQMAWILAENAVRNDVVIKSMYETLNGLIGDSGELTDAGIELANECMWIVSNKRAHNGAVSVIYGFEKIRELALKLGKCQAVIIFSSIHEAIIVFPDNPYDLDMFDSMINDVNSTMDPVEVLASRAYILDL